ncbi:hypothetical protein F0562_029286 [Nyssa sinensis]|uniref:GP-PDE domain-containing protein n=1 Tax=Nyssa sinensis TaxID=561372 RepID=A0A5J5B2E7_9ASTE|nr:hypothetical protein F0562_029286 [Nyssa sinensis]
MANEPTSDFCAASTPVAAAAGIDYSAPIDGLDDFEGEETDLDCDSDFKPFFSTGFSFLSERNTFSEFLPVPRVGSETRAVYGCDLFENRVVYCLGTIVTTVSAHRRMTKSAPIPDDLTIAAFSGGYDEDFD